MPRYVTIRSKRNPAITKAINADIWALEKERHKATPGYDWEEMQPVTVSIPRRSLNTTIEQPEKKNQDVADSVILNVDKAIPENPEPLKQAEEVVVEIPKVKTEVVSPTVISESKEEPKKRGRPKRQS